ncbi:MAG: aminotransferase class III-fold pyridoxal phosphate-dependent enzyme [Rhodobacter sp.]|nr:aminotransferase class III-fold pyridoxal phosphate-dependent enzyme [Rhodobacter sp.]MCA3511715.1 aminotransferase class III-fold pyridoxal phosphate-dependent enzyme [Rhodobacter sp.]MCA3520532.1 aminotransferase class III-fold pyridoxal phosphate-dependent enzyme [Rhodobacter sp.]MCA3523048.1 aminotransferase class III-fold pyridoxal phosphate-dependent enzyme [Rhodobacter sp.]MCA3526166.1 aminotransferase class III-fold pyridoxal phosphate-dependent enzyme [Rhodobacter sp.]
MTEDLIQRRARLMGPNVPTFYRTPVHLVRGKGVWLWDAAGRRYLDCYNNVPHVGHCHPKVVGAICRQAGTLNTHTRYLHDLVLDYIERLTATLGHGISQAIMTCTGSEANDIALRMAQAVTGKTGIIATDNTYHGNTGATSVLSTRRPPIGGYPGHVRLVPAPDSLRPVGGSLEGQARAFAAHVARAIAELEAAGHGFSGMMLCPVFANEGIPTVQPGFLDPTVAVIRQAGGLVIADEVQPGFGRVGSHFWGHDWLGVAPDVVTVGKPMANGHPVAAVLATPAVMGAFRDAFGYFNTFGGNPVSAAACMAVLDVMDSEGLQQNAARVSAHAMDRLRALRHPLLAEVRGAGLIFGAEFVLDDAMTPASGFVADVVEGMVQRGFLLNRIGRAGNTLKIRPPMPFSVENADMLMDALQDVLAQTQVRR